MSDSCTCSCGNARRRRRPSAALVIASLALFMSLGGTSYAAVKAKSIGAKQLKSNSVTSAKIARGAVTASDIRAGVIDGTKIRAGSIGSQHILDGSIGAQDIQPGSIGAREIAANSINSQQIADQSLGLGDINQATVDLFRDVPTTLVVDGSGGNTSATLTTEPDKFTTTRSYSVPAAGTGKTGRNLVQSTVSVHANTLTRVSCWVSVNNAQMTTSSVNVSGYATVPVTALLTLKENDVVQTQCRATGAATADIADGNAATSMTLMRVDD